jgi:hypothetical protein
LIQQWLIFRNQKDFTSTQARKDTTRDILKQICIRILSPLSLDVYACAFNRLVQLNDSDIIYSFERLLCITPNPDVMNKHLQGEMKYCMIRVLSSSRVEIKPNLMDIVKAVLQISHKNCVDTITNILEGCTINYNSKKNVYDVAYPHLFKITRKLNKKQRESARHFFAHVQLLVETNGYEFKKLFDSYHVLP